MNMNEDKLCEVYELDDCVKWINENNYNSIALQFSRTSLEYSSSIAILLKKRTQSQIYVSVSTMCCVDYLTIKHLSDSSVDAIIYFGSVCLTSSQFIDSLPVLYVFGNHYDDESIDFIKTSIYEIESKNTLILYNTCNTVMALELMKNINEDKQLDRNISLAKLNVISQKWNFTDSVSSVIGSNDELSNEQMFEFGPYLIANEITNYDLVIYLGQSNSLNMILNCNNVLEIDPKSKQKRLIISSKELRKRVSKIEKFKENSCDLIGIIFTNPLQNVNYFCAQSKLLGKKLKKKVYFISLIQTLDEYKLGNFAELKGFVVVNSCWCSTVLNSMDYCYPILNWTEFEIASGLNRNYGNVVWNVDNSGELSFSDSEELVLNPSESQLIESKTFDRNKWYGLQVNRGDREASIVKSGQKGIASFYENEHHF